MTEPQYHRDANGTTWMVDPNGQWFKQEGGRWEPSMFPPPDLPAPTFDPSTGASPMPRSIAQGTAPVAYEIPERHHRWVWFVAGFFVLMVLLVVLLIVHLVG